MNAGDLVASAKTVRGVAIPPARRGAVAGAGWLVALALVLLPAAAAPLAAQERIRLSELQHAAIENDARAGRRAHLAQSWELSVRSLEAEKLPRLHLSGEGTYQSDAMRLPLQLPGADVVEAPRLRSQLALGADQLLYDGGVLRGRGLLEAARRAEAEAQLESVLDPLRGEVAETFFDALLLGVGESEIESLLSDLDARLAQVRAQVEAGTALPGDTAAVQAERLRALQRLDEVIAGRAAAFATLSILTGRPVTADDTLELPDLAERVARAEAAGGASALRERAEFRRFARQRERLDRQDEVVTARARPQLRAFATAGIGRPGPYQLFSDDANAFAGFGLRLQWHPWNWGDDARQRELLRIEQRSVRTEEDALTARLEREAATYLERMRHFARAVELDAQIVALREQVERQARVQYEERSITATQYLAVRTDLFEARLAARRNRIELERVRARYLVALGLPIG